jgi:ribonuclease BN (tRNA processing enzyme)
VVLASDGLAGYVRMRRSTQREGRFRRSHAMMAALLMLAACASGADFDIPSTPALSLRQGGLCWVTLGTVGGPVPNANRREPSNVTVIAVTNSHYSFAPRTPQAERFRSLSYRFDVGAHSITYTGDTPPSEAVERLAQGTDLLVSEMIDFHATMANMRARVDTHALDEEVVAGMVRHLATHHLTLTQVAELAQCSNATRVVATHLVPGNQTAEQIADYRTYSQTQFNGEVVFANDLDRFCLGA